MQPLTPEPQGAGLGAPPFSGVFSGLGPVGNRGNVDPGTCSCDLCHIYRELRIRSVKSPRATADTQGMNTSTTPQCPLPVSPGEAAFRLPQTASMQVSEEVLEEAIRVAQAAPDPRVDRVRMAVEHLDDGAPDAHIVAQAVIHSIIADSGR